MSNQQKGLFDKLHKQADINPDEVYKVADSVKDADFSDEKTVRQLVRRLSKLAGKPVSKNKEDEIVKSIVQNKMPKNAKSLNDLFKN